MDLRAGLGAPRPQSGVRVRVYGWGLELALHQGPGEFRVRVCHPCFLPRRLGLGLGFSASAEVGSGRDRATLRPTLPARLTFQLCFIFLSSSFLGLGFHSPHSRRTGRRRWRPLHRAPRPQPLGGRGPKTPPPWEGQEHRRVPSPPPLGVWRLPAQVSSRPMGTPPP